MSNHLIAAKADLSALQNQYEALVAKQTSAETDRAELQQHLNQAAADLIAIEKRHVLDLASDQELAKARQVNSKLAEQVTTVNRRVELLGETLGETSEKIQQAQTAVQAAIFEFCKFERDKAIEKIKMDPKLRESLLAAMGAWANNGRMVYVTDPQVFIQQHLSQITPIISREEVQAAIEKFSKNNDL